MCSSKGRTPWLAFALVSSAFLWAGVSPALLPDGRGAVPRSGFETVKREDRVAAEDEEPEAEDAYSLWGRGG